MEVSRDERNSGRVSSKRVAAIDGFNEASIPVDADNKCKSDEQLKVSLFLSFLSLFFYLFLFTST